MKKFLFTATLLSLSVAHASDVNSESACRDAAITAVTNTTTQVHALSADQEQDLIFSGMGGETKALYEAVKTYCKYLNNAAVELKK